MSLHLAIHHYFQMCIYFQPSSSVANIDEWRFKLSLLLRNTEEQEIISKDKRDRRDYEQIANLAKRMGLYRYSSSLLFNYHFPCEIVNLNCYICFSSEIYGKVVVASKIPLPDYRPDLDDKRPQREVIHYFDWKANLSLLHLNDTKNIGACLIGGDPS